MFKALLFIALLACPVYTDDFFNVHDHDEHNSTVKPMLFKVAERQELGDPKPPVPEFRSIQDLNNMQKSSARHRYLGATIQQFAASRQPSERDDKAKVGSYISQWFKLFGLSMEEHKFSVRISYSDENKEDYTGINYIGFIKGTYTDKPQDEVLVIAAHYDTADLKHGIADNGAGVAALLETARIINHEINIGNLRLDRTVVFAALDFQISEYQTSSSFKIIGNDGAHDLMRHLDTRFLTSNPKPKISAIFLDSIMMYNKGRNTQLLPGGLQQTLPDEYNSIVNGGSIGNFLAMISMNTGGSSQLENVLRDNWQQAKATKTERQDFTLRSWPLSSDNNATDLNRRFSRQGQERFWYYMNQYHTVTPLSAVLLTDTGLQTGSGSPSFPVETFRVDVGVCRPNCSDLDKRFPDQVHFVAQTIDTLVNVITHQQCVPGGLTDAPPTDSTTRGSAPAAHHAFSSVVLILLSLCSSYLLSKS